MRKPLAFLLGLSVAAAATAAAAADFVTLRKKIQVERTPTEVWDVVGDYCAIRDWLKISCEITTGALDNDAGAIRKLGATEEIMIARAPLSYSYFIFAGPLAPVSNHGTLEVRPEQGRRSTITYTIVYDQESLDAAARTAMRARLDKTFDTAMQTMKTLAEAKR